MLKMTLLLLLLAVLIYINQAFETDCENEGHVTKCHPSSYFHSTDYFRHNGYILIGNNYYYFSTKPTRWIDGVSFCNKLGGNLARPSNKQENDYIKIYLKANYHDLDEGWWFGANDILEENRWVWSNSNTTIDFTAWGNNEPDNFRKNQHCAHYHKFSIWLWADSPCSSNRYFICQADLPTIQPKADDTNDTANTKPSTSGINISDAKETKPDFIEVGGDRNPMYQFSKHSRNWFEARDECRKVEAELAYSLNFIESLAISSFKNMLIKDSNKDDHWWIGGFKTNEVWQWTFDNSTIENISSRWNTTQPDNRAGEDCLSLSKGNWFDSFCNDRYRFICKAKKKFTA